jgi:hypothetical protein
MKENKQIAKYAVDTVWITLPSVIASIQESRSIQGKTTLQSQFRHRGSNATIVLLSGACIEGFLAECLESFADKLQAKETFAGRLNHEFLGRLATAAFRSKSDLFAIPLGKTLKNALDGKPIQKDVEILFSFRNCLAHANSAFYLHYEDYESEGMEFVLEGKYGLVRKYLFEKGLLAENIGFAESKITGAENLFTLKLQTIL